MKLTKAIKDQIVINAIEKSGLNKIKNDIIERRAKWAEDVRVFALGGKEVRDSLNTILNEYKSLLDKIPNNVKSNNTTLFRRDTDISVNVAGVTFWAYFSGHLGYTEPRISKVTPGSVVLLADNPLVAEFNEIHNQQEDYNKKLESLTTSVKGLINNITTDKKLLEVWPEAAELIPEEVDKAKQLPAVQTTDLNKMIGLPSA